MNSDRNSDRGSEELELERLVFGDCSAIQNGLGEFVQNALNKTALHDVETEFERLHDRDVFMVDSVGTTDLVHVPNQESSFSSDDDEFAESSNGPAWQDSDDERLLVSLASNNRLRKLRRDESEDAINGREYSKRLRQQYLKLHPTPIWVEDAIRISYKSKDRLNVDSESENSDSDLSDIDSTASAHPLAQLLRSGGPLISVENYLSSGKKRKLRPETINIQRTKHIASSGPSAITSLQAHPTLPFLLASGPSSRMDLYNLHNNPPDYSSLVTSLVLKHTPLATTAFHPSPNDSRIFLSARRRFFHVWDLATGSVQKIFRVYGHQTEQRSMETFRLSPDGEHVAFLGSARKAGGVINVLSLHTTQWVAQARVDSHGGIADFAWWNDGQGLCILGKAGNLVEWSLMDRRAVAQWRDDGGVNCTVLALGGRSGRAELGGDAWVAVGSASGIVNIYSRKAWFVDVESIPDDNAGVGRNPKPVKTLDHLTTPTSHLAFSPDGQLLCMASRWKKDALRLIHLPSCTVYRNWPTASTPFGRISAVAWGSLSRTEQQAGEVARLIIGNEKGKIMAWVLCE